MIARADDMRAEVARRKTAQRTRGLTWDDIVAQHSYHLPDFSRARQPCDADIGGIGFLLDEPNRFSVLHTPGVAFFDVDVPDRSDQAFTLRFLHHYVGENPEHGFRVYRTAAGLRYLCTSALMDPTARETKELMQRLHVDFQYMKMCIASQHFAARITPKPERMFKRREYAVTAYMFAVGNPVVIPDCLRILKYHDKKTGAFSDLPLA